MLGRPSRVAVPIPARRQDRTRPSSLGRAPQGPRLGPVESFVDDLEPNQVLYGVRAALLQRSLEIQPAFFTIRFVSVFCVVCVVWSVAPLFFFAFFLARAGGPASRFRRGFG